MATKKKELLEQENSAPETTVPVENTPPPDEAQADMAAPSDGGDLNELLASMDQTDEDAAPTEDGGTLPELTESEMFGAADADTAAADALPGEDDTAALTEGPDSDDGEDASAVPADDGAADVPGEPVSEEAEEPEPPKPKRATRRKKTAPAESTAPVEEITAEAEPPEPMAPAGEDALSDGGEAAAAEAPASLAEPPAETAPAPSPTPRRAAAPRRSEPAILTIRNREDVETQEDREDIIWHEIHNAYRTRRILTGKLGGIEQLDNRKTVAVVDYKGFRIIIPLKEMMINLGRSPSGQEYADLMLRQNKILGNMLAAGAVDGGMPGRRMLLCAADTEYGRNLASRKAPTWTELDRARWGVVAGDLWGHDAVELWLADNYGGNGLEDLSGVTAYDDWEELFSAVGRGEVDVFPATADLPGTAEYAVLGETERFYTTVVIVKEELADGRFSAALLSALQELQQGEFASLFGTEPYGGAEEDALMAHRRMAALMG